MKAWGALVSSAVHAGAWYRSSAAWSATGEVDGCCPVGRGVSGRVGRRWPAPARARVLRNRGEGQARRP